MADNQLTISGSSGIQSQAATQSPQADAQSVNNGGSQTSGVQPGTATNLLNGQGSVTLHPTALSTVNLNPSPSASQATTSASPAPAKHHANTTFLGFSIVLFLAAVILVWVIGRTVKTTT